MLSSEAAVPCRRCRALGVRKNMIAMELVPKDIEAFLQFDDVVALDDQIRMKTDEIVSSGGESEWARAIFEWVRDQISHSKDFDIEKVTCTSTEVMKFNTGICYAKSHLLAAMMRYAKIPCGFCYQVFENPLANKNQRLALHGLNAIYLEEVSSWRRIDPRGNRSDICTTFSIGDESLAFPDMNFLDDCVYASPLAVVIDGLRTAESVTSLWPHLPSISNAS